MSNSDPFRHHPRLRPLIKPRAQSYFADYTADTLRATLGEMGMSADWITPDLEREADRARVMAGRMDRDLWVFAYGSLMWDPGMHFVEVRRAWMPGVARRFILYDNKGARGSKEKPGVMAALDTGEGCHGLVFRIQVADLDVETYSLWARERIGPGYHAEFLPAETAHGNVEALSFTADHEAEQIRPELTHDEQVALIVSGEGRLGSSLAYLENVAEHLETLRIEDPDVMRLLADVRARVAG